MKTRRKMRIPVQKMTKPERSMALLLTSQVANGTIIRFRFEPIKFRLADNTFYTPDFVVEHVSGEMELREVKGPFAREDSILKFKLAREQFPEFYWSYWRQDRDGGWSQPYGDLDTPGSGE